MNARARRGQGMQPADVDPGFFVGLPQRGGHRSGVAGIGRAAGERRLPGVMAQCRGADGQQQIRVVGNAAVRRAGLRSREQHQHGRFAVVAGR